MPATAPSTPAHGSRAASPAPSARSSPSRPHTPRVPTVLSMSSVANLFLGMRRAQARALAKGTYIHSSSGDAPLTHPELAAPWLPGDAFAPVSAPPSPPPHHLKDSPERHSAPGSPGSPSSPRKKVAMQREETFVCAGAVDMARLLRATRENLFESARRLGANALVDESWTGRIRMPKGDEPYRVHILYTASATRSPRPDPHRPVAVENAVGVPGLMTVLKRED